MKKNILLISILVISEMTFGQLMKKEGISIPAASKKPHPLTIHGHTRTDNYYWINERESPEVLDYLNSENNYLSKVMAPVKPFEDRLFEEMKGRIKEADQSVPYKDGQYYYYSRFIQGGEYPVYCRKKGSLEGAEEILLDGNKLAEGQSYFNIGGFEISDNEQIMAFGIDTISRRNYTLRFKDLKTGKLLDDVIELTEGGNYAWGADNKTIFYVTRDQQTLLGDKVYRHILGTDVKRDELVYEEKDNQYYMGIYRTKSKKYISIYSGQNGVATEFFLLEASNPSGKFESFLPRKKGHEYFIDHYQDKFYVRTNLDNAVNFKLMEVKEGKTADLTAWKEVIPHRPEVLLEGIEVFKNHMVVQERKEGLINLKIINQSTKNEYFLDFGEPAYDAYIGTNPEFDTQTLRFGYNSMTTPSSTFDYNMDTKSKVLMKEQEILGGFDKNNYKTERIFVTTRDGAKVPVSIVYHKDTKIDGTAPLLQYAYGSYGASMDASFSSNRLSLLNRGFVYALCHIRGGQEMGRNWYDDGKMFKKKNTFNDFVDCSKFLISHHFAHKEKLFAMGGSAGGLLMGAVINQAPELYKGVVAAVPFVDVVTTMLDETIPLTTGEFEEWGNPKNKDSYDYMLSYSPYDNVEAKSYPNMLVTTGLHDSQVQYWEPAKWVLKLREMKKDDNLLLMHTNMTAGHGGASGRFSQLREIAMEYVFLLDLAGIKQ